MRLIDADALMVSENECRQKKDCRTCRMFVRGCEDFAEVIENAPTIEERKGRWQRVSAIKYRTTISHIYKCDKCGETARYASKFCSNCGARMEGGE